MPAGKMVFGKPTRQDMTGFVPHVTSGINAPPAWYGGEYYIRTKQMGGGSQHSGPSGKRATRYHAPVDDGKVIVRKK